MSSTRTVKTTASSASSLAALPRPSDSVPEAPAPSISAVSVPSSAALSATSPVASAPRVRASADHDATLARTVQELVRAELQGSLAQNIAAALKNLSMDQTKGSSSSSLLDQVRESVSAETPARARKHQSSKAEEDEAESGDSQDKDDDSAGPALKPTKGVVADVLSNVERFGSLVNWIRLSKMRNGRNRHECEALADIADTLLDEGISHDSPALEKLLRRLSGVHLADALNNWSVCDSLQYTGPGDTLLSRRVLTETLQQAAQMESLMRKVTHQGFTQRSTRDSFGGGRGRASFGRGGRGRGQWTQSGRSGSSSGTSPQRGGAAQQ